LQLSQFTSRHDFSSPAGSGCPEGAAEKCSCIFGIPAIRGGQMRVGARTTARRYRTLTPTPLPLGEGLKSIPRAFLAAKSLAPSP